MTMGKVIFLNGPSSTGKTTIARLLQEKLPEPYMHVGIDKLIGMEIFLSKVLSKA